MLINVPQHITYVILVSFLYFNFRVFISVYVTVSLAVGHLTSTFRLVFNADILLLGASGEKPLIRCAKTGRLEVSRDFRKVIKTSDSFQYIWLALRCSLNSFGPRRKCKMFSLSGLLRFNSWLPSTFIDSRWSVKAKWGKAGSGSWRASL